MGACRWVQVQGQPHRNTTVKKKTKKQERWNDKEDPLKQLPEPSLSGCPSTSAFIKAANSHHLSSALVPPCIVQETCMLHHTHQGGSIVSYTRLRTIVLCSTVLFGRRLRCVLRYTICWDAFIFELICIVPTARELSSMVACDSMPLRRHILHYSKDLILSHQFILVELCCIDALEDFPRGRS